jgi:hypothetical protein
MGSRIATLQRQARELGRLRTGTFDKPQGKKGRPVRSSTWILTSPSDIYIEAAAAEWGGTVEKWQPQGNGAQQYRVITKASAIDAILAPGDPLSQSLEMWNRGGCARRCDGLAETLSGSSCLCVQEYGPEFWKVAPKDSVCKMTTRLNVILPSLPDIGVWRVETGSFWAANEIVAAVDVLKGAAGPDALIPIRLRIEQRTRVSGGQTKHFPVIAVELRGATAGQVLEAVSSNAQISAAPPRVAIEAGRPDYVAQAKAALDIEAWREIWNAALAAGHLDDGLKATLANVGKSLAQPQPTAAPNASAEPDEESEAEVVDDPNELDVAYAAVVDNCPDGWDMSRLNTEFAARNGGVVLNSGTVAELTAFLAWLKGGAS